MSLFVGGLAFRREKRPYNGMLWALVENLFANGTFRFLNWFSYFHARTYAAIGSVNSLHLCATSDLNSSNVNFISNPKIFYIFYETQHHRRWEVTYRFVSTIWVNIQTLNVNFFTIIAYKLPIQNAKLSVGFNIHKMNTFGHSPIWYALSTRLFYRHYFFLYFQLNFILKYIYTVQHSVCQVYCKGKIHRNEQTGIQRMESA